MAIDLSADAKRLHDATVMCAINAAVATAISTHDCRQSYLEEQFAGAWNKASRFSCHNTQFYARDLYRRLVEELAEREGIIAPSLFDLFFLGFSGADEVSVEHALSYIDLDDGSEEAHLAALEAGRAAATKFVK